MILSIAVLSIVGFALSWYAFRVEEKIKKDPTYKPVCDLSDAVSCTKSFLSPYSNMLGMTNSLVGMLFYFVMFLLALFELKMLIFYGALAACLVSVFLAYLLYTKIKSFCLVCTSVYMVNALLLIMSWMNL